MNTYGRCWPGGGCSTTATSFGTRWVYLKRAWQRFKPSATDRTTCRLLPPIHSAVNDPAAAGIQNRGRQYAADAQTILHAGVGVRQSASCADFFLLQSRDIDQAAPLQTPLPSTVLPIVRRIEDLEDSIKVSTHE